MSNFPCATASTTQKNLISVDRERCHLIVLLAMLTAVELLQLIEVGGWGWPISLSVSLKTVACLQLRKRAPSLASAVGATMNCKIVQRVKYTPFNLMGLVASGFYPIKNVCMHDCERWLWRGKTH
jgi:hypothetical protein